MRIRPALVAVLLSALAVTLGAPACGPRTVDAPESKPLNSSEARILDDFKARVTKYEKVTEKLEREVYPRTASDSPEDIHRHQQELSRRILLALPAQRAGDIFTPEIAALFKRRLAAVLNGPDGANIRGVILDENPGDIPIAAMTPYPAGAPVATAPPQILDVLPGLPNELEYRFIGPHLVLRDIAAHLVVDIIPDVL